MPYEIILSPEAVQDFRKLSARRRAEIKDALERHLRHEPAKESRSRIKRLRGLRKPQYRLRVEEYRIFYDFSENRVEVLAIVHKPTAQRWLQMHGEGE